MSEVNLKNEQTITLTGPFTHNALYEFIKTCDSAGIQGDSVLEFGLVTGAGFDPYPFGDLGFDGDTLWTPTITARLIHGRGRTK